MTVQIRSQVVSVVSFSTPKYPGGALDTRTERSAAIPVLPLGTSVTVAAPSIGAAAGLGAVALQTGVTASPDAVGAVAGLGAPTLQAGATATPGAVSAAAGFSTPTVLSGAALVMPDSIGATVGLGSPVVTTVLIITIDSIAASARMPSLRVRAMRNRTGVRVPGGPGDRSTLSILGQLSSNRSTQAE